MIRNLSKISDGLMQCLFCRAKRAAQARAFGWKMARLKAPIQSSGREPDHRGSVSHAKRRHIETESPASQLPGQPAILIPDIDILRRLLVIAREQDLKGV